MSISTVISAVNIIPEPELSKLFVTEPFFRLKISA